MPIASGIPTKPHDRINLTVVFAFIGSFRYDAASRSGEAT